MFDALGRTTQLTYDSDDNVVQTVDALGAITTYAYDTHNNLVRVDQQLDASTHATTRLAYDPRGLLTSVVDANGHSTNFTYDAVGNLLSAIDPLGHSHAFAYDALGRVVQATDARNVQTTFEYDVYGRLARTLADAGGQKLATTFVYNKPGDIVSVTDANGHTSNFAYDSKHRLLSAADALGNTTRFEYHAGDNRTGIVDPSGQRWTYTYDNLNRVIAALDPSGNSDKFSYDPAGNLTSAADKLGRITQMQYDAANELIKLVDAANGQATFTYDANGNRTSIADPNGHKTTFTYDLANRPLSETDPLGNSWQLTYNPVGNLLTQLDPKHQLTSYTYDAGDQLSQANFADGTRVAYTYDVDGHRTSMLDATGTTSWIYDALGRPTRIEQPGSGAVGYTYDSVGNRTALTLPNGHTVSFAYDAADRLTAVTDAAGRATRYTYDSRGLPLTASLPNGITSKNQYDSLGRLIGIQHARGVEVLASFAYTLDALGNRTQSIETQGRFGDDGDHRTSQSTTSSYRYDALDRLLSVQSSDPRRNESFTYDPAGNRLTWTQAGRTTTSTYDDANRLLSAGDRRYQWDANGELVQVTRGRNQRPEQSFSWDARGYLIGVQGRHALEDGSNDNEDDSDNTVVRYLYNGDGVRIGSSTGRTNTALLKDLASALPDILQETTTSADADEDGTLTREFVWGLGLVSQTTARGAGREGPPASWSAPLTDALGSTRVLTDSRGQVTGTYSYTAFGMPVTHADGDAGDSIRGSNVGFAGEEHDAQTGLLDLRARWYDPSSGRFLSPDSVLQAAPGTQGFNRYAYVASNPINRIDPTGHAPQDLWMGWLAHTAIQADYLAKHNNESETSYSEYCYDRFPGSCQRVPIWFNKRIDLVTQTSPTSAFFYEIKPVGAETEGVAQIEEREAAWRAGAAPLNQFTQFDRGTTYERTVIPGRVLTVPGIGEVRFPGLTASLSQAGLITYRWDSAWEIELDPRTAMAIGAALLDALRKCADGITVPGGRQPPVGVPAYTMPGSAGSPLPVLSGPYGLAP